MNQQTAEQLTDLWLHDPAFRARLREDPEGAARGAGIELGEEDLAALRAGDWRLPDQELQERVSKGQLAH